MIVGSLGNTGCAKKKTFYKAKEIKFVVLRAARRKQEVENLKSLKSVAYKVEKLG